MCEFMPERHTDDNAAIYLEGAGIASLAAAAFLIRDGDISGHRITILEESSRIGGSLDASGNAHDGYSMRGGRMLESKYLCTFDLFSSIPTVAGDRRMFNVERHNRMAISERRGGKGSAPARGSEVG